MNSGRSFSKAKPTDARDAETAAEFSWIYALPIAAALIRPTERSNFRLHASNSRFHELGIAASGVNAPTEIRQAVANIIGSAGTAQHFNCQILSGEQPADMQGHIAALPKHGATDGLYLLTLIDRTHEMRTEKNLRHELVSDGLTGLPNRAGFVAMAAERSRDGEAAQHAVLLLDLSRFSRINEHIGPFAGDELIIAVARRLRGNMRGGDVLARTGGDEFAISSRMNGDSSSVQELARRIQSCFDHPFRIGQLTVSISCAIGGAVKYLAERKIGETAKHLQNDEDHLRLAQIALKRAKHSGRIEIYEPEASMISDNRFSMETALRQAIEEDQLSLAFQPLVDFSSGRVAGFEALARWDGANGNPIPPTEFIPIAEDSGLIVPLGQWAIGKAAEMLAHWDKLNGGTAVDCYVSVNVSAIQLRRDDIVEVARAALAAHNIGGERLMIELTESAIIGDPDHALAVLNELKKLKTRIAMDDFGTGYSNLAYLQRLPIDVLKIDRSFVEHMVDDRDQVAIVRTIQSLAEALHLQTTAEGVETADQARLLSAMGCDFGQGYLFARPLDSESALEFWRRSHEKPIF